MPDTIDQERGPAQRDETAIDKAKGLLAEAKASFGEADTTSAGRSVLEAFDMMRKAYGGSVPPSAISRFTSAVRSDVLHNDVGGSPILTVLEREINRDEGKVEEAKQKLGEGRIAVDAQRWSEAARSLSTAWKDLCEAYPDGIHKYGAGKFFNAIEQINSKGGTDDSNAALSEVVRNLHELFDSTDISKVADGPRFRQDIVTGFLYALYDTRGNGLIQIQPGSSSVVGGRLLALRGDLGRFNSDAWTGTYNDLIAEIEKLRPQKS